MLFYILVLLAVFFAYSPWFEITKTLSSGDWPYLFLENIQAFKIPTEPPFLWLEPYYQLTAKLGVQVFSLAWEVAEKIFWFYPFLTVSLVSSYLFLKYLSEYLKIDRNNSLIFISLGSLIFMTNTYILMLVGGGQMGVAMSYSLLPLVILVFFKIIQNLELKIKNLLIGSLILGIQLMFDPRIFLLSIFIIFLYILFTFEKFNTIILKRIFLALTLTVILNLFWILPNFGYFNTEYKSAIDAANASFLSFATFSNSISLLHPNWPENIFGKIGFMKPEFITLPILAYMSLFFLTIKQFNNKTILFFAFLGLFGAFLAKGTNPPFGELYMRLSDVPGFSIFRDPTKFYVLVVVSYMVLVPLSIYGFTDWFNTKFKMQSSKLQFKIQNYTLVLFSLLLVSYHLFLIRPAVFGQLTGTFKPHAVPKEYVYLKDFLSTQPEFTKTLWVPTVERFGFNSRTRPAISAMEIFGASSASGVLDQFDKTGVRKQLEDEEIKYIVIPDDYLKEIFIADRKFHDKLYIKTIDKLKSIDWLSEVRNHNFGKIKAFKVSY